MIFNSRSGPKKAFASRWQAQQAEVAKTGDVASRLVVLQQQAQADRNLYQDLHTKLEEANVVAASAARTSAWWTWRA